MMRRGRSRSQATWVDDRHTLRHDLRALATGGVHLAVLWGFAVAQPYFDVVGSTPAFFAVRGSEPVDIVLFAVGLVLVPPLAMVALEALAGLVDDRLGRGLHLAFVAVLAAAIGLQALERLAPSGSGRALVALGLLIGAGFALAYARRPAIRSVTTVLAPAPLLFCVLFLFFSPVTRLLAADDAARVARVDSRVPVVMVVFDELPVTSLLGPDGRVDRGRYPNFADLEARSTWYRNTATVDSATEQAVPALLDGRWPRAARLPNLADHPRNLFTLLGSSHRLHAAEPVTRLCPPALCGRRRDGGVVSRLRSLVSDSQIVSLHLLLPRDLREGLPSISDRWQGFGEVDPVGGGPAPALSRQRGRRPRSGFAERFAASELDRASAVQRFLDGIRPQAPGERPPLHFLHALFPHSPWQYLPSGRQFSDATARLGQAPGGWSADPLGPLLHFQRHLLQVGYTDRLLGLLLDRLRAARLFDRSLVVVVADHGISFRAGQRSRGAVRATAPDVVPVPLFVKAPGQRSGRVVDTQIRTIDVLPTIAAALQVKLPWPVDGRPAAGAGGRGRDRPIVLRGAGAGPLALAPAWVRTRRRAALRRQLALFGYGRGRPGIYGLGPHPELIGQPVAGLPLGASPTRADIDQATVLAHVDRRTGLVPSHITGDLSGPSSGSRVDLAVAVNGRIAAVSRTLAGGRGGFSFMVPETALRQGPNRVQVLAVPRTGRGTFALLGQTSAGPDAYTLARSAIWTADGRRFFEVDPARLEHLTGRDARRPRADDADPGQGQRAYQSWLAGQAALRPYSSRPRRIASATAAARSADAELVVDVVQVRLHGRRRQAQPPPDLRRRQALGHQLERSGARGRSARGARRRRAGGSRPRCRPGAAARARSGRARRPRSRRTARARRRPWSGSRLRRWRAPRRRAPGRARPRSSPRGCGGCPGRPRSGPARRSARPASGRSRRRRAARCRSRRAPRGRRAPARPAPAPAAPGWPW